jgi:hypothetical protein
MPKVAAVGVVAFSRYMFIVLLKVPAFQPLPFFANPLR